LLHGAGFRRVGTTAQWQLPQQLPPSMRIERIASLIRILHQAQIPLVIDDQRPAPASARENRERLAEIYSGPWTFGTAHESYVVAVAATVQVRGMPVRDLSVEPGELADDPSRTGGLRVTARTASVELADGRAVTWDEAAGWRDNATGSPLPLSQVAEPAAVAGAIAALPRPSPVIAGRDPAQVDLRFEQALATYRTHPAAEALRVAGAIDGRGPYRLMPRDLAAIGEWQPPQPAPPRWEDVSLVSLGDAGRVATAWPTGKRRSAVGAYRPATPAALAQLRQSRKRRERTEQQQQR
jgi:hypothetical protein